MLAACVAGLAGCAPSGAIPPGVQFSTRPDGIEEVRVPTDRSFSVVHGQSHFIWVTGGVGQPDPTPSAGSESIDPERPIFPPHYDRESGPPEWRTPATLEACRLKGLPAEFWVKQVQAYEGKLIATTRMPNHNHMYTSRVDVTVAYTSLPVVLILSNFMPIQWRVGQTARAKLAGVVLVGMYPAKVIGLPNTVPVIKATLEGGDCANETGFFRDGPEFDGLEQRDRSQVAADALSQRLFQKPALGVTYEYAASRLVVGDERDAPATVKPFYSSDRGDVFKRDPDLLLPMELGLDQLRSKGDVRRATEAEVEAWKTAQRAGLLHGSLFGVNRAYVLLRETEIPDGLSAVDFLLPDGVPFPRGSAGSSVFVCVQRLWECRQGDYMRSRR